MRNINLLNRNTLVTLVAGLLTVGSSLVFGDSAVDENTDLDKLLPDIVRAPCEVGKCPLPEPQYYFDDIYCKLTSVSEVHRFELLCDEATYLNVFLRDAAGPASDHWRATVQANNAYESIAVTESGPNFGWGVPAGVYNGYLRPTYLKAAVVCRYVADGLGSPQATPGWAQLAFVSDGKCRLLDHGVRFDEPDAQ